MGTKAATAFWAEHRSKLLKLHARGKTPAYIAAALGCAVERVWDQVAALRKAGVIKAEPENTKVVFTDAMNAALTADVAAGISFKDHAEKIGICPTVLRKQAARLGLKSAHVADLDWATLKPKLKLMRETGSSWQVISLSLGIAESTARRVGADMGLLMKLPTEARVCVVWTAERQAQLVAMVLADASVVDMAERLQSTRSAISSQVKALRRVKKLPPVSSEKKAAQQAAARARAVEVIAARPKIEKPAKVVPPPRQERPAPPPKPAKVEREQVEHLTGYDAVLASFAAPAGAGVSIFDLPAPELRTRCRWPFECDDGETRFCGEAATDGSWCGHHAARAFAGKARPGQRVDYTATRSAMLGETRA